MNEILYYSQYSLIMILSKHRTKRTMAEWSKVKMAKIFYYMYNMYSVAISVNERLKMSYDLIIHLGISVNELQSKFSYYIQNVHVYYMYRLFS